MSTMIDMIVIGCFGGSGSKGGGATGSPENTTPVEITNPIEQTMESKSLSLDDGLDDREATTGKSSLKIPMTKTSNTGLKV